MEAAFLMAGHNPPYAKVCVASIKKVLGCKVIQMTDLKTLEVEGVDEVRRLPFISPFMCYRFEHIIAYPHTELLLLDSDTVVKKDVAHVFEGDFDVALTERPVRHKVPLYMPYNTGVMFSQGTAFWEACLAYTQTLSGEAQRWYADQVAVAHVAGTGAFRVKELQCAEYNWSPDREADESPAHIWHYKGANRKPWIR